MNTLGTLIRGLWKALDFTRRALLNLLLLLLLIGAVWWGIGSLPKPLRDRTALVIPLEGALVEQRGASSRQGFAAFLPGSAPRQQRLRDVLRALELAATDPKLAHVVLDVDDLGSAGMVSLREVAAAIERVKAAGKPVIVYADGLSQRGYFLAAHASEIHLNPMGTVEVVGMGGHRSYYRALFDKVGIDPHVIRAGKYKNAGETFSATGPSPETLEADKALIDPLWKLYTSGVEKARKLPAGAIDQAIEKLPALLAEAGGDVAKLALQQRLVDKLLTEDQFRKLMVDKGASDDDGKSFRRIGMADYLDRHSPKSGGDAIGVVVAEGAIVEGEVDAGRVGGRSTSELIRQAREDKKVKALVLRVRSPGGSAFASEQVRRELELTRAAGKPVVVSMGDVAASGGYWIALAADEVIADEATITGSIGVVGLLPSAEKAFDKVGIHTGGYTTSWLVGGYDLRRGLDPRLQGLIQQAIDHTYQDFVGRTAAVRKRTPEQIAAVAQGRVWTGAQAVGHGLVDRTGSWADAVKAAATRAKIAPDSRLVYFERSRSRFDRLLAMLPKGVVESITAELPALPSGITEDLDLWFDALRAPPSGRSLAHCLCDVQP